MGILCLIYVVSICAFLRKVTLT